MNEAMHAPEVVAQNGEQAEDSGGNDLSNGDTIEMNGNTQITSETEQCEENFQSLTNKLKVALKEILAKDNLVKQHAKVAEDAISGWEKAEAEAGSLKEHLDNAKQHRQALEERVAHLDGALKECVKQLRTGREEQEQKQGEMIEKEKEWDQLRVDLEARLADAEDQVLAVTTENEAFEQRISDARVQAETEVKKVSTKVEALEKENATLKHDVRALKKDLVGLNNESKKAAEASKQQLLDSARKVSKLEADCQRLKTQLRKKNSASSRLEGDVLDRRKSLGRLGSSPRAFSEAMDDCSEMSTKDLDDRFASEEETKALKEELSKRNKELHAARLMCARTASKLLIVEEQLAGICGEQDVGLNGHIQTLRAFSNNQQLTITSQGDNEADAWATALVAELAQFKKEDKKPDKLLDTTSFELMNDFLEMEKLTSDIPHENGQSLERKDGPSPIQKDLDAANELIMALRKKVATLESQVHDSSAVNGYQQRRTEEVPCSNGDGDKTTNKPNEKQVWKVCRTLELLARDAGVEHGSDDLENPADFKDAITSRMQWTQAEVGASFDKLAAAGNLLLQGNGDFSSFLDEVCNTLEVISMFQRKTALESALDAANEQMTLLREELARERDNLSALESEKAMLMDTLHDTGGKNASILAEVEKVNVHKLELEEKLTASGFLVEELRCRITALEDDANVAKDKHEEVQGLKAKLEDDLNKEISARETADRNLQAVNRAVADLECQKEERDEHVKAYVVRIESLETELKRGRQDKLATQKDIDAVNQDIQKLMADFVQLQHEKRALEEALAEATLHRHEEANRTNVHLQTIDGLEEDLRNLLEQEHGSRELLEETKSELDKYILQEEGLHKSLSEKEALQIEMELCLEKYKEERTLLEQKASEQLKVEQGRVSALQDDIGRLELQNVRLEGRLCQSEENLKAQEAGFISLQSEFYQLKIEKEDMEQSYLQSVQQLKTRIATLEEECNRLKAEHADIQNGFRQDVERVKDDYSRSDRELKMASTEKERLRAEVEGLTKTVEKMKEECAKVESELNALKSSHDDVEQKLDAAGSDIQRLDEECSRLESEKMDLEHVLAATNEIVQGVKEECSRLSNVEEELKALKVEKNAIEQQADESMTALSEDLKALEADKSELQRELALSQVRWQSEAFEAEDMVASLRAELALSAKAKQLAEDQLAESFSAKAELQYEVKAASHASSQLEEKTKALEEELAKERSKSRAAAAELDDLLQQQLSGKNRESANSAMEVTSDLNSEKSVDLAAKLEECHRAILNLGEQLQSLSMSRSSPSRAVEWPSTSEESINNIKLKPAEAENPVPKAAEQVQELPAENVDDNIEAKIFMPSTPLEGRPRSKSTSTSTSPAKVKIARAAASGARDLDLNKSFDMGSPSEKPSAFSRFFRGKGSTSSGHHHQ